MRAPLDEFANRLVRNGEVLEFLRGLMLEKGVTPEEVKRCADGVCEEQQVQESREQVATAKLWK